MAKKHCIIAQCKWYNELLIATHTDEWICHRRSSYLRFKVHSSLGLQTKCDAATGWTKPELHIDFSCKLQDLVNFAKFSRWHDKLQFNNDHRVISRLEKFAYSLKNPNLWCSIRQIIPNPLPDDFVKTGGFRLIAKKCFSWDAFLGVCSHYTHTHTHTHIRVIAKRKCRTRTQTFHQMGQP